MLSCHWSEVWSRWITPVSDWLIIPEHVGGSAPEAHRIKHHHVHQELSNPDNTDIHCLWSRVSIVTRAWDSILWSSPTNDNRCQQIYSQSDLIPGARGTKRSASVLPSLTTSRISSKTQSHAVHHGGELHGYYEGDNWNYFLWAVLKLFLINLVVFDQLIYVFIKERNA